MSPDSGSLVFDGEGVAEFGGVSLQDYRRSLQRVRVGRRATPKLLLLMCATQAVQRPV